MGGSWVRGPPNSLPFDFTDGGWVDSHASVSGENKERALDALLDDAVLISGGHTACTWCLILGYRRQQSSSKSFGSVPYRVLIVPFQMFG
ncbi:hypothetical protein C8J56DRAFT_1069537 [Mycena floridula]|nr:hypothetical protein C8J56DRAFT_1069537 [Mycena floridula]